MTNEERLRAIAATEASIRHHERDVLAPLLRGERLGVVAGRIGSEDCELCLVYFDECVDCVNCPLFQFGAGCNEGDDKSPWERLRDAIYGGKAEAAIAASRHMITTLKAVRAMLTLTATSDKPDNLSGWNPARKSLLGE
jgi:hypothetical protein